MLIKSERKPLIEIITFQQKVTKLCTKQLTKFEQFSDLHTFEKESKTTLGSYTGELTRLSIWLF